jgi:cell division transport system permease protein
VDDSATQEQLDELSAQLNALPNVASCTFVSKAQAVEDMKVYLGAENASVLDDYAGEGNAANPLPASFRIQVVDLEQMGATVSQIKQIGGDVFYRISAPTELSDTLISLERVVSTVGWALVIVLGAISVVVINNTIRLTVFARRKEINIMKFVGATNAFIRMPFFVEGMTVGALAGAVASVVVGGGYYALLKWLEQPEAMWLDEFTRCMWSFQDIVWPLTLGFILFGMLIGSTGCATSIRRHLKV